MTDNESQVETLRKYFESGGNLTVGEALTRFGVYALSQRCGDLRESGCNVQAEMIRLQNGKRIARYRLVK